MSDIVPIDKKCKECGLWNKCRNPYLDVVGQGGKGVMFLFPHPTITEDKNNSMMTDESQRFLMDTLSSLGINFEADCWGVNALQCYPGIEPETMCINACRLKLMDTINRLQPTTIIPLGPVALHALIGPCTTSRISLSPFDKWVGYIAPDQELKCNIAPIYHPDEIVEKLRLKRKASMGYGRYRGFNGELWNDPQLIDWCDPYKVINRVFKRTLKAALKVKPVKIHNYEGQCKYAGLKRAVAFLRQIVTIHPTIAFDYETTGIKPHRKGHEILCVGISTGDESLAFPIYDNEEFKALLKEVLTNRHIRKIGHNMKYEETWTRVILGYKVRGWMWDCMLVAHTVDNRRGVTGLKFQGYNYFGVLGYDDDVEPFMKATKEEKDQWGANAFNRLKEVPVEDLCTYCAIDAHLTFKLHKYQLRHRPKIGNFRNAFRLMHDGSMAFTDMEQNGIMVDEEQLMTNDLEIEEKLIVLKEKIAGCEEAQQWNLEDDFNFSSPKHLKHLLFGVLKYPPIKMTEKGFQLYGKSSTVHKGFESTDAEVLEQLNSELTLLILKYKKLYKIKNTYLAGIKRETINGIIHPSFNLNTVSSFRSCVAKGSLILTNKDYKKYPNGVPIEQIKKDDYVYSFDNNLGIQLKKVLWAGKTGHRKVVRIHYKGYGTNIGHLDVTPEHKIRLINGQYVEACDLLQDFRNKTDPKWKRQPKSRVLSIRRQGGRLFPTNLNEIFEHRFVYESFTGELLGPKDIIHHKNGDHLDNEFSNLEKTDHVNHARIHYPDTLGTTEARKKNIEVVKRNHRDGKYTYYSGYDSPRSLKLSKEECIHLIKISGGKLTQVPYDFDCFKNNCVHWGIDIKKIKLFFNREGEYISKKDVIFALENNNYTDAVKKIKVSFYKLRSICDEYGITYSCKNNGIGHIVNVNNHVIVKIEYLDEAVDVYDIEVEGEHNFIANEICVHNSSSNPNFQNFSKHDEVANHYVKGVFRPRQGRQFIEYDYGQLEVRGATSISHDENLIMYTSDDTTDMHRDAAAMLFLKEPEEIDKKTERFHAKNKWVFAQFYGDWYKSCAISLWKAIPKTTKRHLRKHKIKDEKGDWVPIRNLKMFVLHCKEVERKFWEEMFPGYNNWRNSNWRNYVDTGIITWPTGFTSQNVFRRNQVNNLPVQGGSFHLTLGAVILINKRLKEEHFESLCIGQVHDSIVFDAIPEETDRLSPMVNNIMTKEILKTNPWVIVPLKVDADFYGIDGDWATLDHSEEIV